jgi:hypothetical protein
MHGGAALGLSDLGRYHGVTTPNVKNRTLRLRCANPLPVEKQTQQTFATQNIGILLSERRLAETFVSATRFPEELWLRATRQLL